MSPTPPSLIRDKLQNQFGSSIIKTEEEPLHKVFIATVESSKIREIIYFLYHDKDLPFTFLTSLFAVHFPENKGRELEIVYLLHNLYTNTRMRIKAYIPIENPRIDSVTPVFAAAGWMERETYDFFGVLFNGHTDLRRILNVEDMNYFPMRKEYPLEEATRSDKDDTMFGRNYQNRG